MCQHSNAQPSTLASELYAFDYSQQPARDSLSTKRAWSQLSVQDSLDATPDRAQHLVLGSLSAKSGLVQPLVRDSRVSKHDWPRYSFRDSPSTMRDEVQLHVLDSPTSKLGCAQQPPLDASYDRQGHVPQPYRDSPNAKPYWLQLFAQLPTFGLFTTSVGDWNVVSRNASTARAPTTKCSSSFLPPMYSSLFR